MDSEQPGRAKAASRTRPLDRAQVIDAARAVADRDGLGGVSSRTVSAALGVTPMALYRHVEDMDEVMSAVVDDLLAELGTPRGRADWRGWLEQLARSFRVFLHDQPEALALFARRPVTTPAARARLDRAVTVLGRAGLSPDEATRAYAAVHTYTVGFSALDQARRLAPMPSAPLDAAEDPTSSAIRGFVSEDQFARGLRALVSGLDAGRDLS